MVEGTPPNEGTGNTKSEILRAEEEDDPAIIPYSIFTAHEKWIVVALAAIAGLFSPLSANVFFPAIPTIAGAFHKPVEFINLAVTTYMVMQGISPMLWGPMADRRGRRPIFLACMVLLSLSCVGLALVPTSAYWLLLLLRCIQAAGSASSIAIGSGVIADIATPAERGNFFGIWNLGPMVGPCAGPVLGGIIADRLGWRAVFWFLCTTSAIYFLIMLLFLPETLRSIVGDGSINPTRLNRPLIPLIGHGRQNVSSLARLPESRMLNPFRLFLHPDVLLLLVFNAILYSVWYAVTTTISTLFQETYPFLNETDIGLCFLAIGGGLAIGSTVTGRVLDNDYQSAKRYSSGPIQRSQLGGGNVTMLDDVHFQLEKTRLRRMPLYLLIFCACTVCYGWCFARNVHIAAPLILQVILGYCAMATMTTTQTLIIDLFPKQGSAITACNNLVRCTTGATLVSVINLIINGVGAGWTFVILGVACLLSGPMIILETYRGPLWRERRWASLRQPAGEMGHPI